MNFLTPEQVAEILQVNKMTVYREIKRGKLKAYKFGKELRIRNSDFEVYLQNAYNAAQQSMSSQCSCISQAGGKTKTTAKMAKPKHIKKAVSTKTAKRTSKLPKGINNHV